MTSYWDTSSVVPLLVPEPTSTELLERYHAEQAIVTWWGTLVECESALLRRQREGLSAEAVVIGRERLRSLRAAWTEVHPADEVRTIAVRILGSHALRAADALQLAAAVHASDGEPGRLPFVTLDRRPGVAAAAEGFRVVGV